MRVVVLVTVGSFACGCARTSVDPFEFSGAEAASGGTSGGGSHATGGASKGGTGFGGTAAGGTSGTAGHVEGGTSNGGSVSTGGSGIGGSGARPPLPDAGCSRDGVCQVSPQWNTDDLVSVWASSETDVWVVGNHGALGHYDGRWQRVASGTTEDLYGVWGTSETDVWFVGARGTVIHYDGFELAHTRGPDTALDLTDVKALAPDDVWISAGPAAYFHSAEHYGDIFHFDGAAWAAVRPASDRVGYTALWASPGPKVWLGGDDTSYFDGARWQRLLLEAERDIWAADELNVFGIWGENVWRFDGTSTMSSLDADEYLSSLWGQTERDVWVVGNFGYLAHFDGNDWTRGDSGTVQGLRGVFGLSSTSVWVVGEGGTVLHYDGQRWNQELPAFAGGQRMSLTSIWGANDEEQWVTAQGTINRLDGNGLIPYSVQGGEMDGYTAVWGVAADDVVAVGPGGVIAEFDGDHWARVESPTDYDLLAVWAHSAQKFVATGSATISRSARGQWQLEPGAPSGSGHRYTGIWGASEDDIWVVARGTVIFQHYVDSAWTTHITSGVFAESLWGAAADDIWGVNYKTLSRFDGERWSASQVVEDPYRFRAVTGCSADDVWAVGERGAVYHFDGQSFSALDSGTAGTLNAVRCSAGGVWIVGDNGLVLHRPKVD